MRIGNRKGILDPKKLGVIDVIDFAGMSDTDDLPLPSPGNGQTKSGRASFKNELTKRFGRREAATRAQAATEIPEYDA